MHIPDFFVRKCPSVISIGACVIICFTFGHFYSIGNVSPYVMSYLNAKVDKNVEIIYAVWLSGVCLGIQGAVMPLVGLLAMKTNMILVIVLGCLINSGGLLLSGASINWGYLPFLVTYSLMAGIGMAVYGTVLSVATSWAPTMRGLVTGICTCGYGAGAVVFTLAQASLINPNNMKVNTTTHFFDNVAMLNSVPRAILIIGVICAMLQLISLLCLRIKPNTVDSGSSEESTENISDGSYSPTLAMKTMDFCILWLITFCGIFPLVLVTSLFKIIGQRDIHDDQFLTFVGMLGSVANMFSRLVWGKLCDLFHYKILLLCVFLLWGVLLICLPFSSKIPEAGRYIYAFVVVLLFVCIAGFFVLIPVSVGRLFGQRYFPGVYGLVFTAAVPGSLIGSALSATADIKGYVTHLCSGCSIVCFIGTVAVLLLPKHQTTKARIWSSFVHH